MKDIFTGYQEEWDNHDCRRSDPDDGCACEQYYNFEEYANARYEEEYGNCNDPDCDHYGNELWAADYNQPRAAAQSWNNLNKDPQNPNQQSAATAPASGQSAPATGGPGPANAAPTKPVDPDPQANASLDSDDDEKTDPDIGADKSIKPVDPSWTLRGLQKKNAERGEDGNCVKCGKKLEVLQSEAFCGKCEIELEKKEKDVPF